MLARRPGVVAPSPHLGAFVYARRPGSDVAVEREFADAAQARTAFGHSAGGGLCAPKRAATVLCSETSAPWPQGPTGLSGRAG